MSLGKHKIDQIINTGFTELIAFNVILLSNNKLTADIQGERKNIRAYTFAACGRV